MRNVRLTELRLIWFRGIVWSALSWRVHLQSKPPRGVKCSQPHACTSQRAALFVPNVSSRWVSSQQAGGAGRMCFNGFNLIILYVQILSGAEGGGVLVKSCLKTFLWVQAFGEVSYFSIYLYCFLLRFITFYCCIPYVAHVLLVELHCLALNALAFLFLLLKHFVTLLRQMRYTYSLLLSLFMHIIVRSPLGVVAHVMTID